MKIGFETIVKYTPGEVLGVREHYAYLQPAMAALPVAEQARIRDNAPDQVHRLRDISAAEIMTLLAANKALASCGLDAHDIDCLLVAQTGGKQFMPLIASYIHLNMGFKRDIRVRNIVDDNVSAIDAAKLAWSYVRSGLCERALIVAVAAQIGGHVKFGVDLTDPHAQWYGDGAAAAIVSANNLQCEFLAYHSETHAVKSRPGGTLIGNLGPVRSLVNPALATKAGMQNAHGAYLGLEGPLFDELVGRERFMAESLGRVLKKAGLLPSDLSMVIAPHIGHFERGWTQDLARAGVKTGALRNWRRQYGNTAVVDHLLSLAQFCELDQIQSGEALALWAACPGVQQSSLLLRWI